MRILAIAETPSWNCFDVFRFLFYVVVIIVPLLLLLIRVVALLVFNEELFGGVLDVYGFLWEKGFFLLVCLPFATFMWLKQYSRLTSGYYFERSLALIELRDKDYSSYHKANKLKIIPVLVRLLGWITALTASSLTILRADISLGDLGWWQYWGYLLGSLLGCLFWVWIWNLVARTIEKRIFGVKLPWTIFE